MAVRHGRRTTVIVRMENAPILHGDARESRQHTVPINVIEATHSVRWACFPATDLLLQSEALRNLGLCVDGPAIHSGQELTMAGLVTSTISENPRRSSVAPCRYETLIPDPLDSCSTGI